MIYRSEGNLTLCFVREDNMNSNNVVKQVRPAIEEIVTSNNLHLYDLEFVFEEGTWFLRVAIEKDDGTMDFETAEVISDLVSSKLDELDPIDHEYVLDIMHNLSNQYCEKGEDYVYENSFVENIRKNFLEGDQTNVLCLENGEPVACATLCFISMMPTFSHPTGKRAHLMNVYVRKEYRRMGLARKMLELLKV